MEHSPANGEFCMYNGAEQHSPESNDGFQKKQGGHQEAETTGRTTDKDHIWHQKCSSQPY